MKDPRFDYYDAESAAWLDPIEPEPVECRNPVCRKMGDPDFHGYCSRMCDHDHWFHQGIER